MVRVSAVLPVHNRRDLVIEALDSILHQSYRDFEVLIADDGSTDGTPLAVFERLNAEPRAIKILSRMSATTMRPFSHILHYEDVAIQYHYASRGLSAARNRAIRNARGTWLAFLEPEYLWDPAHLERLVAFITANPRARICYAGERTTRETGRSRRPARPSGWVFEQALSSSPLSIATALVHRSCFSECGGFDENLPSCEDYDLWLRLAARHAIFHVPGDAEVLRRSPRPDGTARGAWQCERFRVYALEKSFQSGHLNADQRLQVAEEIVRKCERLVEGLRKQESEERANFYERKRRRFSQEVRKLRSSRTAPVTT